MKKSKIVKRLKRLFIVLCIPVFLIIVPVGINKLYESIRSSFITDAEKRIEDVERLTYVMQNEFSGYNVLEGTTRFNKQITYLKDISTDQSITQKAFNLELFKAVAAFKDPHTAVTNTSQLFNRFFPYRVTWSSGDFYLTSGVVNSKWLGAKVTSFDNIDSKTVFTKLNQYTSSPNKTGNAVFMSLFQSNADLLYHEKIINSPNTITLGLTLSNGETTKVTFDSMANEQINTLNNYMRLSTKYKDTKPLWKTNSERNYWFKYLKEDNLFYLRYAFCVAQGDINLFWEDVFNQIEKTNPNKFIIDLRGNPGGDTQNHAKFLNDLAKNSTINKYGKLYTIIDRKTGSAAVSLASNLERLTETILVGEKTIDLPNTTSDPTYFTLPHSGVKIVVPNLYHLNTHIYDKRDAVVPDIPITQLIDDKNYDEDQVLNAIKKMQVSNAEKEKSIVDLPSKLIGKYSFSPLRNLTIKKKNNIWKLEIDGLIETPLFKRDSMIYTEKYNIKLRLTDSLYNSIMLEIHGSEVIAKKINADSISLITNIEQRNFDAVKAQLLTIKLEGGLPYYIGRPLLQTTTYDIYLNDGFDKAYEFNRITKSIFPDDPVVSIIDYELYEYDSNTLGQVKSVFPIAGKLIKRYYDVITTEKIMNDDYNPFIGH